MGNHKLTLTHKNKYTYMWRTRKIKKGICPILIGRRNKFRATLIVIYPIMSTLVSMSIFNSLF